MSRVVCYRSPCAILADGLPCDKCRQAPVVSDPLLSTPEAKRARGTAILDNLGQDWQPTSAEIPADVNMMAGDLIEKVDHEGRYKAQLDSITYTVKINKKEFSAVASLALRRVAENG